MTDIQDQNGLLAGLLKAGRNGNNPCFAAAKQLFEHAQEKIRNHLIHKFTESAEATDNPTQDLRKLGTHWEAFCKNASWPPAFIDFIKQDTAKNGALEQAKALHETAAVQAERAVLSQVGTLSLADFPHAQPLQNGNLQQVTEQPSVQAHIDQGQFTLDQKLGELCRGATLNTLPLRFGLPLGHWDAWTEDFDVNNATDLLPACEAESAFMTGLRQRLQQDLKLESAELLLLLCRSGWNDVRNHLQSLLPPDYLIQDAQAEGFQNSVFRGEDGYLYQITSCSHMTVLDADSKTIPISGQFSFVARLTLEGPQWIAQWASNAALTNWLSGERTTATPPELQALSQETANAEQGQPTTPAMPHRWIALPPPKDATEAEKEKTLLTALNATVETLIHTASLKEAQEAYDQGVAIINQSSLSDRVKSETKAMLSGPVKALQSRQWEEQKRLAGAGTAEPELSPEEKKAMIVAVTDHHQQSLEQYKNLAIATGNLEQLTTGAESNKKVSPPKNWWSFFKKPQTREQPLKQDVSTLSNHVMVSSKV